MRRSMLAICALLAVTTAGCDKIKGLLGKKEAPPVVPPSHTVTPPPAQAAPPTAPKPAPARTATTPGGPVTPVQDRPYSSPDTGTVAPGMTESQVYSLWGAPVAVRHAGTRTYLFFPNGCERSCGTADVVTLDNGQVVDAIVRWYGHGYSGQSSSPRSGPPTRGHPTTLTLPDTTPKDTGVAPAPAPTPTPTPAPVDTVKKDTLPPAPKPDSLKPKPDSGAKDSTGAKPDSVAKDSTR